VTFPSGTYSVIGNGANTFSASQTYAVNTVASSASPAFNLALGNLQYIAALANNATATVSNIAAGGSWTFVLCQDGTGSRTFAWPASVHGGITIGSTASGCSSQHFTSPDGTRLIADTGGVINQ
jgi:hypothetical protein